MKNFFTFLNESNFEYLNVGDRVVYNGQNSHYKDEPGTVIYKEINKILFLVEFDRRWRDSLHSGTDWATNHNIKTNSNSCYYYYDYRYFRKIGNWKKLENPEIDPFGEENWGYKEEE